MVDASPHRQANPWFPAGALGCGDADTTGALAGMLAGAAYGAAAIPRDWIEQLDRDVTREIDRQVALLFALSP